MCSGRQTPTGEPEGADGNTSSAATAYVASKSLNCREAASADAAVVTRLTHGDALTVTDSQQGWSKVQRSEGNCWVATRLVVDSPPDASNALATHDTGLRSVAGSAGAAAASTAAGFYAGSTSTRSSGASSRIYGAKPSVKKKRKRRAKMRSTRPSYYGGGCPCSGGTVCIGPRGGRYCITSGGNKRYGV